MEQTFIILKPDALRKGLVGSILTRFEQRGFLIKSLKQTTLTEENIRKHYHHHADKPFFGDILNYMTSGEVIYFILQGDNVVHNVRLMVGETDCSEASPGTIRGDYGIGKKENLIHASDSVESAKKEIDLFCGGN